MRNFLSASSRFFFSYKVKQNKHCTEHHAKYRKFKIKQVKKKNREKEQPKFKRENLKTCTAISVLFVFFDVENQALDMENDQATEQWLRQIPDDPGGLLRRKFEHEYQMNRARAMQR